MVDVRPQYEGEHMTPEIEAKCLAAVKLSEAARAAGRPMTAPERVTYREAFRAAYESARRNPVGTWREDIVDVLGDTVVIERLPDGDMTIEIRDTTGTDVCEAMAHFGEAQVRQLNTVLVRYLADRASL
jgi:hypothetical protein